VSWSATPSASSPAPRHADHYQSHAPSPSRPALHDSFLYDPGTKSRGSGRLAAERRHQWFIESGSLDVFGLRAGGGQPADLERRQQSLRLPLGHEPDQRPNLLLVPHARGQRLGTSFTSRPATARSRGFTTAAGTTFAARSTSAPTARAASIVGVSKLTGTTYGAWAGDNFVVGETVFVVGALPIQQCEQHGRPLRPLAQSHSSTFGATNPPPATIDRRGRRRRHDLSQIDRFFLPRRREHSQSRQADGR